MRTAMCAIIAAGAGLMAVAVGAPSAQAMIVYPWCAHYGGRQMGGAPSCGFVSFAQCMATVSGSQGTCEMNPWYEPAPPPTRRAPRRSRN